MIELTTGVAFLLSSMYGTSAPAVATAMEESPATTTAKTDAVILQDRKAVETYLKEQFADTPLLVEIARCESTFSHYNKEGKLLRGRVDRQDVGVMQINERYHREAATKLGFDLHTIDGNIAYAKYLYQKEGARPWKASQPCWSNA